MVAVTTASLGDKNHRQSMFFGRQKLNFENTDILLPAIPWDPMVNSQMCTRIRLEVGAGSPAQIIIELSLRLVYMQWVLFFCDTW